jgi:SAM-dependent methyltransferase
VSPKALLLGVTPEIATMRWPAGTELTAVERCQDMIDGVWPGGELAIRAHARLGDWRALPVPDASVHFVIGDGAYTTLAGSESASPVTREIRRVLRRGAHFIHRHFVRPETPEAPSDVFSDLEAGCIGNFHVFKWRLAMALHGNDEAGVRLADVWVAWHERGIGTEELTERFGWPRETIATIDAYRGVTARYAFPTLAELRRHFAAEFVELDCHLPSYELGQRCPLLLLSART